MAINEQAIVKVEAAGGIGIVDPQLYQPLLTAQAYQQRQQVMAEIIRTCLHDGVDYRKMPGNPADATKALTKAGAEKLMSVFGLRPAFVVETKVEDWTGADHGGEPFFLREFRCQLWRGDFLIGEGLGSCCSWESKYRYRWVSGEEATRNGYKLESLKSRGHQSSRFEFEFALQKKETTGRFGKPMEYWQRFEQAIADGTAKREQKETSKGRKMWGWSITFDDTQYRMPNPDGADVANTVLKMSQKRSLVAAVLVATNASDSFTQDVDEDLELTAKHQLEPEPEPEAGSASAPAASGQAAKPEPQAAPRGETRREPPPEPGDMAALPPELAAFIQTARKPGKLGEVLSKATGWLQEQLRQALGDDEAERVSSAIIAAQPKSFPNREAATDATIQTWLKLWAACRPKPVEEGPQKEAQREPQQPTEYQVSDDLEGIIEAVKDGHDHLIANADVLLVGRMVQALGEAEGTAKFTELTRGRPNVNQMTIGQDGKPELTATDKQMIFDGWVKVERFLHYWARGRETK